MRPGAAAVALTSAIHICAISAAADPFEAIGWQAGRNFALQIGQPFTTNGSLGFFKSAFNTGPVPGPVGFFGLAPELEFDSYATFDPVGPSVGMAPVSATTRDFYGDYADGFYETTSATTKPIALLYGNGSDISGSVASVAVTAIEANSTVFLKSRMGSGFAPRQEGGRSTIDGLMLARLTVELGASIDGQVRFRLWNSDLSIEQEIELVLDGDANFALDQPYSLQSILVAQPDLTSTHAPFALADTYDIWLMAVPAPSSVMTLLTAMTLGCLRRRR